MNFLDIVKKHNYDNEFSSFLKLVYDELVKYYKDEKIIYEALLATPIISHSNVYDYLKDNNYLDSNATLVSDDTLKRSKGVHCSIPEIIYDSNNCAYQIKNIKSVVVIVEMDLNNPYSKATLIHEISHLIKSYYQEYKIVGDILIEHSGLIRTTYKLSHDKDKVTRTLLKEFGVGLEEGLTSAIEEDIARNIISPDYKVTSYGIINALARNILVGEGMEERIIAAELYHDDEELINYLGLDNYNELNEIFDEIYSLILEQISYLLDHDKMMEYFQKIEEVIITKIPGLSKKIKEKIKENNM